MYRNAKIVATIGPACQDENTLTNLIKSGVNIARLNFSHGTYENHTLVYQRLRHIADQLNRPITILQDLQGPKIRTGEMTNGQVELATGQPLTLTTRHLSGTRTIVPVDFPELLISAKAGNRILIDDGNLELHINEVKEDSVETTVVVGGILKSHKGVNLPGAKLEIPGFTEKDEADLKFGLQLGIDAVAVSFVRSAQDIDQVRLAIARLAPDKVDTPIIAKLERPEAIDNLAAIVDAADGVMVARGDLGVEMSPEAVPIAQKCIIQSANSYSKLVITATQMLDSMINNPRPTRAEASDVANAIFDGTDAVMLSGETASGKYPVQSVEMMASIVHEAEAHMRDWGHWQGPQESDLSCDDTYFMTRAAKELAHDRNVAAVAVFTKSGRTALLMSKLRPSAPIIAFTPEIRTFHRLNMFWGVYPRLVPQVDTIEAMLEAVDAAMLSTTSLQPGQQVVLICGYPVHAVRPTNLALLHTIGEQM